MGDLSHSVAWAINNNSQIVVNANSTFGGFERTVLYAPSANGSFQERAVLQPTAGRNRIFGFDINDSGQVVGTMSCEGVCYNSIGDPAPAGFLGTSAFLYSQGSITTLPTLGGAYGAAVGINNAGQIIGTTTFANGNGTGFLFDQSGGMQDINSLFPVNSGWTHSSPSAINNVGQIVGSGLIGGQTHGFLLTPMLTVPPTPPTPLAGTLVSDRPIDKNLPTIVLTHGLEGILDWNNTQKLWSSFGDGNAGKLIRDQVGSSVNILQYVWMGGFQVAISPDKPAYVAAWEQFTNAGMSLAKQLVNQLGTGYAQTIDFVGHSLGTAVNTVAARYFLANEPSVTSVQFTALDRPDHVDKIPEISALDEKYLGFDENWFSSVLPNDSRLRIDNYYSLTGVGVGDTANGPIYNHGPLVDPGGLLGNDHSGVQKWYRDTIDNPQETTIEVTLPDSTKLPLTLCNGTYYGMVLITGVPTRDPSLNPCRQGWYWALNGPHPELFPTNNGSPHFDTQVNRLSLVDFAADGDCKAVGFDGSIILAIRCRENSSPFAKTHIEIPSDGVGVVY